MRFRMSSVPSIPVTIDEKNISSIKGALDVLKVVRPKWINSPNSIKSKVFTDGLSNKLVGFFTEENPEDTVIVKIYGLNTDDLIDRKTEIETMKILHERKCGAELYATFSNGLCYEYMNGKALEIADCWDPLIYPLVAEETAHMHSNINNNELNRCPVGNPLWSKMHQFNKLAEESMAQDQGLREQLQNVGVTPGWAEGAIRKLQTILEKEKMPLTFCHNDLNPRNIVYDGKRRRITFIDVEYAMPNYPAFDVANHFLEFAGPPELIKESDYMKCPDREFRLNWLREYLRHLQLEGEEELTVEKFNDWVDLCTPASHLFWGLWAIHQARHSTIQFDYVKYLEIRLKEFKRCMDELQAQGKC